MKSRRSSDVKLPVERPKRRRRKQQQSAKDEDKWLIPSATTTLHVALPNEWIAEMEDALDDLRPALRDREDFVCEACRYALESWKEGTTTPEGKALLALARRSRRRAARQKTHSRDHK